MREAAPSHAELMDEVYRHQRYVYDFTRKYYLFGRDRLIRGLALAPGERVVEIGCGTARNPICMARRFPRARFYGLDASQVMLRTARTSIARAGLADRITLAQGYAERLTPDLFGLAEPFVRAVFSYSLSMIPDWHTALNAARASLSSSGRLHIVDFGDLMGLGHAGQKLMPAWLGLFHVEPRTEILEAVQRILARKSNNNSALDVLPGRYAFVFSGPAAALPTEES